MSEITEITQKLIQFRDERDWQQFHNSKDLALAVSIEAGELLELFLWKGNEEVSPEKLRDELADVLSYCFLLAEKHGLSVTEIIQDKISKNATKYPADKAKGNATKYTDL
jgi:NTP pyrophosphatase (non-canonical NTP hydrolase)